MPLPCAPRASSSAAMASSRLHREAQADVVVSITAAPASPPPQTASIPAVSLSCRCPLLISLFKTEDRKRENKKHEMRCLQSQKLPCCRCRAQPRRHHLCLTLSPLLKHCRRPQTLSSLAHASHQRRRPSQRRPQLLPWESQPSQSSNRCRRRNHQAVITHAAKPMLTPSPPGFHLLCRRRPLHHHGLISAASTRRAPHRHQSRVSITPPLTNLEAQLKPDLVVKI
ncbi:hypothetical protein M0R45_035671 [Rubus argutus]|uniref:Uncharacterized protein n=1 Tax=Rubus argutus TaxID=59490 RepID=A0AAW1VXM4_RUBAR